MKTEKSEIINDAKKLNEEMEMNNYLPTEGIPISTFNKIELKQKINSNNNSNNRMNNRRSINDLNNDNMSNKTNSNISNQNSNNNNNNYQALRATSVKSVEMKGQTGNESIPSKRKNNIGQNNNHFVKLSYGLVTFKFSNDKKENENKGTNNIINNNKNNENNTITNYANNNKTTLNNNNIGINNNNIENKNNANSFINIDRNRRDTKAKNNHSIYISVVSKK